MFSLVVYTHVSGNLGAAFVSEPRFSPKRSRDRGRFREPPRPSYLHLPTHRQRRPRGPGAAPAVPGSPEQEAPSSGAEPSSPGTSLAAISEPLATDEEGPAPGGQVRAPEGLTPAGRSRPARDRAAPSATAPKEVGKAALAGGAGSKMAPAVRGLKSFVWQSE